MSMCLFCVKNKCKSVKIFLSNDTVLYFNWKFCNDTLLNEWQLLSYLVSRITYIYRIFYDKNIKMFFFIKVSLLKVILLVIRYQNNPAINFNFTNAICNIVRSDDMYLTRHQHWVHTLRQFASTGFRINFCHHIEPGAQYPQYQNPRYPGTRFTRKVPVLVYGLQKLTCRWQTAGNVQISSAIGPTPCSCVTSFSRVQNLNSDRFWRTLPYIGWWN